MNKLAISGVFILLALLVVSLGCEEGGGSGLTSDADTDGDTDGDTDVDSDSDTDSDSDSDTDSDTDGDTDSDSDSDSDTDSDSDSDSDSDTDMDAGPGCVDEDSDWWCEPFDCNDSDPDVHPGAIDWETDSVDNDCDGVTDEGIPDTDVVCGEETLDFDIQHVKLMILLDYSGSMDGGTPNKWDSATDALTTVLTGDLAEGIVDFGFEYFPIGTGCDLHTTVYMDCAPGATYAESISTAVNALPYPAGTNLTPLYNAMYKFYSPGYATNFQNIADNPNAYLVLVADGADHSSCGGHSSTQLGTLAANLHTAGITTIMVGFGTGVTATTLNAIGTNGGFTGYPSGYNYFTAEDSTTFEAALEDIVADIVPCTYPVDTSDPGIDPDEVNFYFDGVVVPYNSDCNTTPPGVGIGWRWTSAAQDEVEFCVNTCQDLKDGDVDDISATFGCPSVVE